MSTVTNIKTRVSDTLQNLVSMLGTDRDKAYHNRFILNLLTRDQLESAYRGDWVSRKIVDVPAKDCTREGRNWQADEQQIEDIENEENRLGLMLKLKSALIKARLYGGGALILGLGDDAAKPLEVDKVKKGGLKYVHAVAAHELKEGSVVTDVSDRDFGMPENYIINPAAGSVASEVLVHRSRVVRLVGAPFPDRSVQQNSASGWGDSILQAVHDAVMNVAGSTSAVAYLIQELKLDVVKIPDFMKNMSSPTYEAEITDRFALANQTKSLTSTLIMDREEEWERVNANFGGLPEVMKLYLLIASGAADIPATRLLGQSAVGLNSTGDGDLKNYYDHIKSEQTTVLTPALEMLDQVLVRSALGSYPEEIWYEWAPLWQMTENEKADIASKKAATTKTYVEAQVIDPIIMQKIVYNQLVEDGTYPGIEQAKDEFEAEGGGVDERDPEVQEQFGQSMGKAKKPPEDDGTPRVELRVVGGKNVKDAEPHTLYVRRNLMNARDVLRHFAGQIDADQLMDAAQLHVTVAYSKTPVDWTKIPADEWGQDEDGVLRVKPGGMRMMQRLGPAGAAHAVVMNFASVHLSARWRDLCQYGGCSWDFDDYQPHVTIAWDKDYKITDEQLRAVEPWQGQLVFGPEIFAEIDEDWKAKEGVDDSLPFVDREFDEDNVERDDRGRFSSGGGGESPSESRGGDPRLAGTKFEGEPKGSSPERVAMRAALKDATPEVKAALQQRIVDSFKKDHDNAERKGNAARAASMREKGEKYAKLYGVSSPFSGAPKEPETPRAPATPRANTPRIFGNGKNRVELQKSLAFVPDSHLKYLEDVKIESTQTMPLGGFRVGGTNENVLGHIVGGSHIGPMHIRVADKVRAGINPTSVGSFSREDRYSYREAKDVVGTLFHEIGHAVHFRTGLEREISPIVHREFHKNLNDWERSVARYYDSNERERFAELYRLAYEPNSRGAFGMSQKTAEYKFRDSISALRKHLGERKTS